METFRATTFDESNIELECSTDIEKLVNCIENEEKIIIQYKQGDVLKSKLIVAEDMFTKVKDGSLSITSKEQITN